MAGENRSNVEQRVLQAAKQVLFARGFHNSSLRAIAKKAGTSESGVLRFYQGKLHLLQCVFASCWTEINDRLDKVLAAEVKKDPDPRNLLLEVARFILEEYQAEEPMMHFMLYHFGFEDTAGYTPQDDADTDADTEARRQYRRYLLRINDLCDAVVAENGAFAAAGINGDALANLFLGIVAGIPARWYGARLEPGLARPQLTIDEALRGIKLFLYQEAAG